MNFGHRICVPIRKGKKWLICVAMIKIMKGRKGTEAATALNRPISISERENTLCKPNKILFCLIIHHYQLFFLSQVIILNSLVAFSVKLYLKLLIFNVI